MPKKSAAKASSSSAKHKKPSKGRRSGGIPAAQTILNVLGTLASLLGSNIVPREKMVAFAKCEGVTTKSSIANSLTKHRKDGLIEFGNGTITITDKGIEKAETIDMSHASNEEYHAKIKVQFKLSARACQLFDELVDGRSRNKKEMSSIVGCKTYSSWANMLTPLKKLKIVDYDKQTIKLTDDMFPFGRPTIE